MIPGTLSRDPTVRGKRKKDRKREREERKREKREAKGGEAAREQCIFFCAAVRCTLDILAYGWSSCLVRACCILVDSGQRTTFLCHRHPTQCHNICPRCSDTLHECGFLGVEKVHGEGRRKGKRMGRERKWMRGHRGGKMHLLNPCNVCAMRRKTAGVRARILLTRASVLVLLCTPLRRNQHQESMTRTCQKNRP